MKSTRRDLFKKAALGGTTLAAANMLAACSKAEKAAEKVTEAAKEVAKPELEYVKGDAGTAKALGYVENASTMSEGTRPDKGETKGSAQFCNNCQFYSVVEGTQGGKCSLFPGKLVKDQAWCRSWSLKAQA